MPRLTGGPAPVGGGWRRRRDFRAATFFCAVALLGGALSVSSCGGRPEHVEHGIASWHAPFILGRGAQTASGERWLNFRLVGAHRRLPFGTVVRVVNLENGRSVKVRIIDRGPYVDGRIIDVSRRAASRLRMRDQGLARVRIEVVKWP